MTGCAIAAQAPSEARMTLPPETGRIYWRVVAFVLVADQVTKALIRASLPVFESVTVIPGFVDFTHVHNTGVAFGLMNSTTLPFKGFLTAGLALGALAGIVYYSRQVRAEERFARVGLSLILAGAVGNLVDRLWLGFVVDFVDVYFGAWHFWAFNVADASISIGAVLVFADLLLVKTHASDPV
jgi:signal peptidase II